MNKLLLRPPIKIGEGPQAYLLRVACTNGLTIRDLLVLGILRNQNTLKQFVHLDFKNVNCDVSAYVLGLRESIASTQQIWNTKRMRFCPHCIGRESIWKMEWEHQLYEACIEHGCWLVDRCQSCNQPITPRRALEDSCKCGCEYKKAVSEAVPQNVMKLTISLHQKLKGQLTDESVILMNGLNHVESVSLIRFLGCYGNSSEKTKIPSASAMNRMGNTAEIVSMAAKILDDWPRSFNEILHKVSALSTQKPGKSISKTYGSLYFALYRRFAGEQFSFMRRAFEQHVVQFWTAPLAKRNKRLTQDTLAQDVWIPSNHATSKLLISKSRLSELVESGKLTGRTVITAKGRTFIAVQRSSAEALLPKLSDEMSLKAACQMLGLQKDRLLSVLPQFLPEARKTEGKNKTWAISRKVLEEFCEVFNASPLQSINEEQVLFGHVIRYWNCSTEEIGHLLMAIRRGELIPVGYIQKADKKLGCLVFETKQLRDWIELQRRIPKDVLTVPKVAAVLSVKQEVAYFLVRNKVLKSMQVEVGHKKVEMVSRASIDEFQRAYVFAREISTVLMTTSRALRQRLESEGITNAMEHINPPCRQIFYRWTPTLRNLIADWNSERPNLVANRALTNSSARPMGR